MEWSIYDVVQGSQGRLANKLHPASGRVKCVPKDQRIGNVYEKLQSMNKAAGGRYLEFMK